VFCWWPLPACLSSSEVARDAAVLPWVPFWQPLGRVAVPSSGGVGWRAFKACGAAGLAAALVRLLAEFRLPVGQPVIHTERTGGAAH
jgi:hypothetical protein